MKHYTFNFVCSFTMQFTVPEKDVEQDPGGADGEVQPTDDAMMGLQRELEEYLGREYAVADVDVDADSDSLLGVDEDPG